MLFGVAGCQNPPPVFKRRLKPALPRVDERLEFLADESRPHLGFLVVDELDGGVLQGLGSEDGPT